MDRPLLLWCAAVFLAGLGTAILFDAAPGLGWSFWTLAAAGGLLLCVRAGGAPVAGPFLAPLAGAVGLGIAATITAAPPFQVLIAIGVAVALAASVLTVGDQGWERLRARFMLGLPVAGPLRTLEEAIRRVGDLAGLVATPRHRTVVRGALLAAPVVSGFTWILSDADPVLGRLRDDLAEALARLEFVPRLVFFVALLTAALGGCGIALRRGQVRQAMPPGPTPTPRLADTERLVVLGSVIAVFTAFLLLQLSYLFGNTPAVRGSGVTFAEYARRGFAELTTVATLATLLLAALDRWAARGPREPWARVAAVVVVVEVEVLLVSALRRLWLYESAYGFTTTRLHAHVYMIGMAVFLALLGGDLWRGLNGGRLARRGAAIAALATLALVYWNHEAWIVRRNVERYVRTDQLDATYLIWGLSPNAVPALVATLPRLSPTLADSVRDGLRQRYGAAPVGGPCRWFEWNRGRERAATALREGGIVPPDVPLQVGDCVPRAPLNSRPDRPRGPLTRAAGWA